MFAQESKSQISIKEFGINAESNVLGLSDVLNPDIPEKKYHYFSIPTLQNFLAFMSMPENSSYWLWGLHGTGKTSMVEQTCARLNWPCYSYTGSASFEIEDMLYQNRILPCGSTIVELCALAKAFVFGGVCLFNEIDLVHPSKLTALNDILSGTRLIIPGIDKVLIKHENFRFVVAANTNGSFDESTGIGFGGTQEMNIAFMDRFLVDKAEYLTHAEELAVLKVHAKKIYALKTPSEDSVLVARTSKLEPILDKMICLANRSRLAADNEGTFKRPISIRGLERWIQKTIQFENASNPVEHAFKQSIINAYSYNDKIALEEFYSDSF